MRGSILGTQESCHFGRKGTHLFMPHLKCWLVGEAHSFSSTAKKKKKRQEGRITQNLDEFQGPFSHLLCFCGQFNLRGPASAESSGLYMEGSGGQVIRWKQMITLLHVRWKGFLKDLPFLLFRMWTPWKNLPPKTYIKRSHSVSLKALLGPCGPSLWSRRRHGFLWVSPAAQHAWYWRRLTGGWVGGEKLTVLLCHFLLVWGSISRSLLSISAVTNCFRCTSKLGGTWEAFGSAPHSGGLLGVTASLPLLLPEAEEEARLVG